MKSDKSGAPTVHITVEGHEQDMPLRFKTETDAKPPAPTRITRPRTELGSSYVTTPIAATMIALLGPGILAGSVVFTRDQFKAVKDLYGFKPEGPNKKPPAPKPPKKEDFDVPYKYEDALRNHKKAMEGWDKWEDPKDFHQAGADRNALRHAEADGLRLLAWIAKYVPKGEDPLKTLVQMAMNSGFDVDPSDCTWAEEEDE